MANRFRCWKSTISQNKVDDSSHRLFMANDLELTQAMAAIFKTCPAIAAHITFLAEENRVQVEYNPLWRELAEQRFAEALHQNRAPPRRKTGPKKPKKEKDRYLRSEFSIIEGKEEFVPYPSQQKPSRKKKDMER